MRDIDQPGSERETTDGVDDLAYLVDFGDLDDPDPDPNQLSMEDWRDPTRLLSELPEISHNAIDLEKVPHRLWEQTLAPLHPQQRGTVVRAVCDPRLQEIAWAVANKLDQDAANRQTESDRARHKARRAAYPLPTPTTAHAAVSPTVQVNIRLRADDHQRLAQAADAVGLKPTTLARALVLNGAGRIIQEHAR